MKPVTKRYFKAVGERAERVIQEGLAQLNEANARHRAITRELGAIGTYGATEMLFPSEEPRPGLLFNGRTLVDEKTCYRFKPDLRTKVGKYLASTLKTIPLFDFSRFACKEFKVGNSVFGPHEHSPSGMAMYESVAGIIKGTLIFAIPFGGDMGNGNPALLEIPADLVEMKYSEYVALTEED